MSDTPNTEPNVQDPNPDVFPPGPVKHFVKELISNPPVRLIVPRPTGNEVFVVPFTPIGDDMGEFSTADVPVIALLRKMQKERRQGVREVTAAELERVKKASGVNEKRRASLKQQSLLTGMRADSPRAESAAVAKGTGFPDPVDTEAYVSDPKSTKLDIPAVPDRTPKARRAKAPKPTS